MEQKYAEYAAQKAVELLAIDSPTGFTDRAAAWVQDAFGALGFAAKKTAKGGVLIDLGGAESEEGALLLQAHCGSFITVPPLRTRRASVRPLSCCFLSFCRSCSAFGMLLRSFQKAQSGFSQPALPYFSARHF